MVSKATDAETGAASAIESKNKALKGIFAGGLTAGIEVTLTFPLEFVKTQLQLDEKGERKKFNGFIDCIRKTVKERGFLGLYRGMAILIYGSIPKAAVRFGSFEFVKSLLVDSNDQLSGYNKVLSGTAAGVIEALMVSTQVETIKVKFINDQRSAKPQFKGLPHGVYTIIKREGIAGIYKAPMATVLKDGSNQAIRFFVVESLKEWYKGGDRDKPIPKLFVGCFGATAGVASVLGNAPLDVIKTRLQGLEAARYKGIVDCAIQIWKNEGITGYFKGTAVRMSRVFIEVALTYMIYDSFMDLFMEFA